MAYETFERKSVRIEDPAVTIAPVTDGRIALNAAATRLFQQAGIRAVRILWDKTRCGIALQAARRDDANSFSIAYGGRHSQATITPKAFLKYIGWTADSRHTVRAKWDAQQRVLEAELPPRFVNVGQLPKPGLISPEADSFGGNDNNRRVAERIAKERSIATRKSPSKLSREGTD